MINIDKLAEYLEPKIWNAWPKSWVAKLYSYEGDIYLKFRLKKYNRNCYSYRLYDSDNQCLISGVSIHGLAAYIAPFVLQSVKEKKAFEAVLFWLFLKKRQGDD